VAFPKPHAAHFGGLMPYSLLGITRPNNAIYFNLINEMWPNL
jgi:hypothetical protein